MPIETWIAFCATETVLCLIPGPAVLLVVSLSLSRSGLAGLRATFGILAANTLYFALSATSIGVLIATTWQLFVVLKVVGASYLIWLGVRMLFSPRNKPVADSSTTQATAARPLLAGFLVQGANPKALLFFTALLSQFVDHEAALTPQILILGFSSLCIELLVLGLYVVVCRRARTFARDSRYTRLLERIGGMFLIAAGVRLAGGEHS